MLRSSMAAWFCGCAFAALARGGIVAYPVPDGVPRNDDFSVRVRVPGGAWQDLFVYAVEVKAREVQRAAMVTFDFSGEAELAITSHRAAIASVRVRPASAGVAPTVEGGAVRLRLTRPCDLSVELNGDRYHNLHVFTNAPESDIPNPADPQVIYLGPGIHRFPGRLELGVDRVTSGKFGTQSVAASVLDVPSGQTLYLAGGAVLEGTIRCAHVKNVRIRGRGIVLGAREGLQLTHSENITVDGLIVIDPDHYTVYGGDVHGLTIRHLRAFSCRGNGDGIDLMCCTDVLIDRVFLRNSDDTIALYNHRWDFYGDTRNVTVSNSTLWADVAHPIQMGTHGFPPHPETLEHLAFSNIDILEHNEAQLDYQGCMSINVSDENLARDIRFENIRIADFTEGQLVNLRVAFNRKYCTAPGRGIEDVLFKNITYEGSHANISIIEGYDDTRMVRNVTFQGLVENGRGISWKEDKPAWYAVSDPGRIYLGPHVDGVQFLPADGERPPASVH